MTPARAIILGASRGVSRLDLTKSSPLSLETIEGGARRVLDWHLFELEKLGIRDVVYVGGYHIEKVVLQYPKLRFYFNPHWENGSELDALLCARAELSRSCLILRSDILFRGEAVKKLISRRAPMAAGVDARVPGPYASKGDLVRVKRGSVLGAKAKGGEAAHFIGILALGRKAAERFLARPPKKGEKSLSSLLSAAAVKGGVKAEDFSGLWVPVTDGQSLARFTLGTKAQTLDRLQTRLKRSRILAQKTYTVGQWTASRKGVLSAIAAFSRREGREIAVRSSALSEDAWNSSAAGQYRSVLGVEGADSAAVESAVDKVVESFGKGGRAVSLDDQFFVQPCVADAESSGVILTRDLYTGAPYYIINSDSSSTDAVTSGRASSNQTIVVWRKRPSMPADPASDRLIAAAEEIEDLLGHDALDIEFVTDKSGSLFILQVRPLVIANSHRPNDADMADELSQMSSYTRQLCRAHPHLLGNRTILSNMSDWNPAEMIGACPRPLALSLYQELITDSIWSQARAAIGYRDAEPAPLVVSLGGHAYVDVRASLNSFLPAALPEEIGAKLIEHQLSLLESRPELHDKIEFEVSVNCHTLDADEMRRRLARAALSPAEAETARRAFLRLTDGLLRRETVDIGAELANLKTLGERRERSLRRDREGVGDLAFAVFDLASCVKRFGTLPFAKLARLAFVAMSLLRSLRDRGALSEEEFGEILQSIPTVASKLAADIDALAAGKLSREDFLRLYGHLRPNSYNIVSPNYRTSPELYLSASTRRLASRPTDDARARRVLERRKADIDALLRESGFSCGSDALVDFILEAIPARETAKFEFTKNLDAILELTAELGERLELSRENVSFLSIERLLRLATDSPTCALNSEVLHECNFQRKRHRLSSCLRMPHFVARPEDLEAFRLVESEPNFITGKSVTAKLARLDDGDERRALAGKIAIIEQADPGYDWLFSHDISGLVTKYGGVASHMAIRAAEFGLPAAIGCGEIIFERLRSAQIVTLDCAEKKIVVMGEL